MNMPSDSTTFIARNMGSEFITRAHLSGSSVCCKFVVLTRVIPTICHIISWEHKAKDRLRHLGADGRIRYYLNITINKVWGCELDSPGSSEGLMKEVMFLQIT
jgi:hypothetical protein